MPDAHLTNILFTDFDLPEAVQKGLLKAGFSHCTPIQAETLPIALAGGDVAGQAQTGTGKTAAFLVATFNRLMTKPPLPNRQRHQPRALILAPTRELAVQIHREAQLLGEDTQLKLGLAYGGLNFHQQRKQFTEGMDILIGTPGRLIDCFQQHLFDLRAIDVAVLDEADRMFDLGFLKQLRFLLRRLPKAESRLNLMFSATLSWRVTELAYEHMNNPTLIKVDSEKVAANKVNEIAYYAANNEKVPLLLGLLNKLNPSRAIVFINTKRNAEIVASYLLGNNVICGVLTGDVPQPKRLKILAQFQHGELHVLVATDVAARGLHIPDVSLVVNFDLPQEPEEYVHRIGRTARIGAEGTAISFACEDFAYSLPDIEEYIGHSIPMEPVTENLLPTLLPPKKLPSRKPHKKHHKNSSAAQGDKPRRRRQHSGANTTPPAKK